MKHEPPPFAAVPTLHPGRASLAAAFVIATFMVGGLCVERFMASPDSGMADNAAVSPLQSYPIHTVQAPQDPALWLQRSTAFTPLPAYSIARLNRVAAEPRNAFHTVLPDSPQRLDGFAEVLSAKDASLYRRIFALFAAGDLETGKALMGGLENKVLQGYVEATYYLHPRQPRVRYAELAAWLTHYADLPAAPEIYAKAVRLRGSAAVPLAVPVPPPDPNLPDPNADSGVDNGDDTVADTSAGGDEPTADDTGAVQQAQEEKTAQTLVAASPTAVSIAAPTAALPAEQPLKSPTHLYTFSGNVENAHGAVVVNWRTNQMLSIAHQVEKGEKTAQAARHQQAYAVWKQGLEAEARGDSQAAYLAFNKVLAEPGLPNANKAAAAFWLARTAEKLGKDPQEVAAYVAAAALHAPRSFYGMLALAKTGSSPQFNWQVPTFTPAFAELLKAHKVGQRALALLQIGERQLAEQALRHVPLGEKVGEKAGAGGGNTPLAQAMLAFATHYGMPALALQLGNSLHSGHGNGQTYDAALYPLLPWQPAGGYRSDAALVMAVARGESRFDPEAHSPVGARGVMQLMPETAAHLLDNVVATKQNGQQDALLDAKTNVMLGDRYLQQLAKMDGIDGNVLLLIAAYNCGPGKLQQLMAQNPLLDPQKTADPLLFIELMPLKETHDYVQQVLTAYGIYRTRLGLPPTALADLANGVWPHLDQGAVKTAANQVVQ